MRAREPSASPALLVVAFRLAEPLDEEGAGAVGGVEHRDDRVVGLAPLRDLDVGVSLDVLGPRGRVGDAQRQAEGLQRVVDGLDDVAHDRERRVEGAQILALLGVVLREELLVEVDDRVVALVVGAEVGEQLVDVGDCELLGELVEAQLVDVDDAVGVVAEAGVDRVEEVVVELQGRDGLFGLELLGVRDASGEKPVDHRLGVDVGEAVRGQVAEQLLADVVEECPDRAAFGLDLVEGADLVADVLGDLGHARRQRFGRPDALAVSAEPLAEVRAQDDLRAVRRPQNRSGTPRRTSRSRRAAVGSLLHDRTLRTRLPSFSRKLTTCSRRSLALGEAEEQQVGERPLRVGAAALARPLVLDEALDEPADGADRQAAAVELQHEDAEALVLRERRDLRDVLELGDLLRVEVEFLGLPLELEVVPRQPVGIGQSSPSSSR